MNPENQNVRPLNWEFGGGSQAKSKAAPDYTQEELDLLADQQKLDEKRQEIETKRKLAEAQQRQEKLAEHDRLKKLARGWRKQAGEDSDRESSAEKLLWADEAEAKVQELALELGLVESVDTRTRVKPVLNTNIALGIIAAGFILSAVATKIIGNWTMTHYPNDTLATIIANTPVRASLSFTIVFLSFLVAAFMKRLFFTPLYRLWHSNVQTTRSFQSIIEEAPAWALLLSILLCFFGVMLLFVMIFTSLFA